LNPSTLARRQAGGTDDRVIPAPHTAIVYALDGVRLIAAAASRHALMRRVAEYVRRQAGEMLWANDARRVDQLLAERAHEEAVELYFALVGQRWDEEWIVLADPTAS
jgi:hypothetical protein